MKIYIYFFLILTPLLLSGSTLSDKKPIDNSEKSSLVTKEKQKKSKKPLPKKAAFSLKDEKPQKQRGELWIISFVIMSVATVCIILLIRSRNNNSANSIGQDEDTRLAEIKNLIDNGKDVNQLNRNGNTLLHEAVKHHHGKIVEYLITPKNKGGGGADINAKDGNGRTALTYILQSRKTKKKQEKTLGIVKRLIHNGAELRNENDINQGIWSDLFEALGGKGCDKEVIDFLAKKTTDINMKDEVGNTILHLAVYGGLLDTVKLIASYPDLDVNARDNDGNTALHLAALEGHRDIYEYLVKPRSKTMSFTKGGIGVDVTIRNNKGKTAEDILQERRPRVS